MTSGPLRLAFLADSDSIHTRRWLEAFLELGHEVTLLVAMDQQPAPGLPPGVRLVQFHGYGRRLRPRGALRARRSLRAALATLAPDVVHAHAVTRHGWLAWLAGRRPYVVTAWGSDLLLEARRTRLAGLLARRTLGGASLVTVDSLALGAAAIAFGADPARLRLVRFATDPQRFRPGPGDPGLRRAWDVEGRRVVFSPRSLQPLYRQDVAIRALAALPPDVALVLSRTNAHAATEAALRELATRLGVADRIRWLAGIDHAAMPAAYRLADVVLSIPESDSMPVTIWEALASGRPVVATDLPDPRGVLAAVEPSALVPVGDVPATASALLTALQRSPAERKRLARRLRAIAVEQGDQGANMRLMETLYRAVVDGRPPPDPTPSSWPIG